MIGKNFSKSFALPQDQLVEILKKYGKIK